MPFLTYQVLNTEDRQQTEETAGEQALSRPGGGNVLEGLFGNMSKTTYEFPLWPYNHTSRNLVKNSLQKCAKI